jgi:hypothetical protein
LSPSLVLLRLAPSDRRFRPETFKENKISRNLSVQNIQAVRMCQYK